MNKKDRETVIRIRKIIKAVPLPHNGHGGKTASTLGAISYAEDMRVILPYVNDVLFSLVTGDDEDTERDIEKVEEYIKRRNAEQWKSNR